MSWVNDLASGLGIPAGAATLAVAMYAACCAAEKVARPEALQDIARVLQNISWENSVKPSAIILRIFNWTFGYRHLSVRCIIASLMTTNIFVFTFSFIFFSSLPSFIDPGTLTNFEGVSMSILVFLLIAAMPDYVSLAKSRIVFSKFIRPRGIVYILFAGLLDVLISILIAIGNVMLYVLIQGAGALYYSYAVLQGMKGLVGQEPLTYWDCYFFSTLFTSVWTSLILLSTTVIKLLSPIHHFTAWFFDVDKLPVQAIGIVSGALVMIGAGVWSLVRWLV